MKKLAASELILNPDGSIYHLHLKPKHVADTIIFVGDQDRIPLVSKYFDSIEFDIQNREFRTITGLFKGKRITVISTGIGTDNIDIVLNELDALVNINLETRTAKTELKSLKIIRIGTSGAIQRHIPVDSFIVSKYAIGFDGLLHSYKTSDHTETAMEHAFIAQTKWNNQKGRPYIVKGSERLLQKFSSEKIIEGFTATAPGFYAPQGRVLRLALEDSDLNNKIEKFNFEGIQITNLEMETSAIYGLSKLLGHEAISMNAILANRPRGTFSKNPLKIVENLIKYTLNSLI